MGAISVEIGGNKLNYRESVGTGSPILLIHGNSSSCNSFENQITGSLGTKHRVIAIDLPGHGNSQPFSQAADYSLPTYAKIISSAARNLGIENATIVGWSLGGHIALEMHNDLDTAKGIAIFGTPPVAFPPAMEEAFLPNEAMGQGFVAEATPETATAYANAFFAGSGIAPQSFVDDVLNTDGNARVGFAASIAPDGYQDEVEIVKNMTMPLAVLHGAEEQLVNLAYIEKLEMPTLWRGAIQLIENTGHAPHWEDPNAFNDLVAEFAADAG